MLMKRQLYSILIGFASLLLVYFLYLPGLSGDFIFDDLPNLQQLNDIRTGSGALSEYLSLSSRPLAFLSFLLNDNAWPSEARSFKLTNIQLHLICSVLLFWLFYLLLLEREEKESCAARVGFSASLIWAVHPLFVSTTLFIVQRMTMLSAMFVIAALIAFLYGRRLVLGNNNTGWILLLVVMPILAVLGLMCKENAALLPLYLLILESVYFSRQKIESQYYRHFVRLAIYLPVGALVASIVIFKEEWYSFYLVRDFSLLERLLTESRILFEYLALIILPKSSTNGLHYENFPLSTSLLDPWTTLLAVLMLIAAVVAAIAFRKRSPLASASVLFFLAGHSLESSFYPLELYYEHRNYLPSILLFLALVELLHKALSRWLFYLIVVLFVCMFAFNTYSRSTLWGNQLLLYSVWLENNPTSARTYAEASTLASKYGNPVLSFEFLSKGRKRLPEDAILQLGYISYGCQFNLIKESDLAQAAEALRMTRDLRKQYVFKNMQILLNILIEGRCPTLRYEEVSMLFDAALENINMQHFPVRKQEILHAFATLKLNYEHSQEAFDLFKESFLLNPQPDAALSQVAQLASNKQYRLALEHLDFTQAYIYNRFKTELRRKMYGWLEMQELRERLDSVLDEKVRSQQKLLNSEE